MPRGKGTYKTKAAEVTYRSVISSEVLDSRGLEYFDELPAEIQVIILGYIPFQKRIKISRVSKLWRALVVQCPVDVLSLSDYASNAKKVNPSWIGFQCHISQLDLSSILYSNKVISFVNAINSARTFIDTDNTIVLSIPPQMTPRTNVIHYRCGTVPRSLAEFAECFPNLETLAAYKLTAQLPPNTILTNLRKIFISSVNFTKFSDWNSIIPSCKEIAPNLEEMYLPIPNCEDKALTIEALRLQAKKLHVHVVIDLFNLIYNEKLNEFAAQFKKNNKPYCFYGYKTSSLFGRAVVWRRLKAARFLLDNGYTALEDEIGSYKFPKEFDRCIDARHDPHSNFVSTHPFILDENMHDEQFMDYLLAKGLDVNLMINGRTFFECYSSLRDNNVVKHIISKADVDFSMRTSTGDTLFHLMAEDKTDGLFEIAKQRFADLDDFRDLLHAPNNNGVMPIHIIFKERPSDLFLEILLPLNIDLEVKADNGCNVYNLVANRSDENLVNLFLEAGYCIQDDTWISLLFRKIESSKELAVLLNNLIATGSNFMTQFQKNIPWDFTPAILNALVDYGYDIYAPLSGNKTLLFKAILSQDKDTVDSLPQIISEFGFDVNHMDDEGYTPLLRVLDQNPSPAIVRSLLEAGADPNLYGPGIDHALWKAHHLPDRNVSTPIVKMLLKHKADINFRKEDLQNAIVTTPFMEIASANPRNGWKVLTIGGNLKDTDSHNNTILHIARDYWSEIPDSFEDINVENVHGETALFTQHMPTTQDLACQLKRGANVVHVSKAGLTPLHNALLTNNQGLIRVLLEDHVTKIDLSHLDNMGRSVGHLINCDTSFKYIHNAVLKKSLEERKKIIEAFNNVDDFGNTSIHYAIKSLSFSCFGKFVTGFRLNVNPATTRSPLSVAISEIPRISLGYARLLIELGASVTCQDSDGNTPLQLLCSKYPNGDILITQLLKKGASVSVKNNRGKAPIDMLPTIEAYLKPKFYPLSVLNSLARGVVEEDEQHIEEKRTEKQGAQQTRKVLPDWPESNKQ